MGNNFFKTLWASSHPALEWNGLTCTGYYVCKCGYRDYDKNKFHSHVVDTHTQDEAIELLPSNVYNKAYKTEQFLKKEAIKKANRTFAVHTKNLGLIKIPKESIYSYIYDYIDPFTKKLYTKKEVEDLLKTPSNPID